MSTINQDVASSSATPSTAARRRMLGVWGEPLFYADWLRTVFIHFEVDAAALQRDVPFELDLHEGRAYLSLVAFTMCGMRPRRGGKIGEWLFSPIGTHEFLNVRAYVRHRGECGIHFLAEWLPNPLCVRLGPPTFGLPYRLGRLQYEHQHEAGELRGKVADKSGYLEYQAEVDPSAGFRPCETGSRDEFLVERYTAFTVKRGRRHLFRIWHQPWPQVPVNLILLDLSLLTNSWPWFKEAELVGANYSPGVEQVWMGRPLRA